MARSIAILTALAMLAFASAAPAAPTLQLAPATQNAEIRVSVSELDPEQSYWATIVPPDAAPGAYEEFLHVAGAESADLAFSKLPAGVYEIRLHARGNTDPLVARLPLDLTTDPGSDTVAPEPDAVAATRNFAASFGLVGDWEGLYQCPDGNAEITMRLWPGHGDRDYLGTLHVRLITGPDAGNEGEWSVSALYDGRNHNVSITPDLPTKEPRPRYGMATIREAVLSEDGLRLEGGRLMRHGCTNFELARVPVAPPIRAAEEATALTALGFSGEWTGEYACKDGVTRSLTLEFTPEPTTGLMRARWRYVPAQNMNKPWKAEIDYLVSAAPGGAAHLLPLRWGAGRPYRHMATPVSAMIAPDGRTLSAEIRDCGHLRAERVGAPPAQAPAARPFDAEARATLAALDGAWEGIARCGVTEQLVRLELSGTASGTPEGELRHLALTGIDVETRLRLRLTPRPGPVLDAAIAEKLSFKKNGPLLSPAAIAPAGEAAELRLEDPACSPVRLTRVEPVPALNFIAKALPGGQDKVLAMGPQGHRLYYRADLACPALAHWLGAMTETERRVSRAGSQVIDWGGWPAQFTEPAFSDTFGVPWDPISGTAPVGQMLTRLARKGCGGTLPRADALHNALAAAFDPARGGFGRDGHRFRAAVRQAAADAAGLPTLLAELSAADGTALSRLEEGLPERVAGLRASDRVRIETALADRRAALTLAEEDRLLTDLSTGATPATLENLRRVEEILATRPEAKVARVRTMLSPLVEHFAAEALVPGLDPAETEARFAPLRAYPGVARRLDALQEAQVAALRAQAAQLEQRIRNAPQVAALRPLLVEAKALRQAPGGAEPAKRVLAALDARGAALVAQAAASLPSPPASDAPVSGGALAGLKRNALITAFLSGDPMVPYRTSRDETMIYLQRMALVFREYCPAALPANLTTLIAGEFTDLSILTGGREAMAAAGMEAIGKGLEMLLDPGKAMAGAMRTDLIHAEADGDAQTLLHALPCTGPELRKMFVNIRSYVADPSAGIDASALRMGDLCLRALGDGFVTRDRRAYCTCAGEVIERNRDEALQRWLRADPPTRWRLLHVAARPIYAQTRACVP